MAHLFWRIVEAKIPYPTAKSLFHRIAIRGYKLQEK